jgi:multidrug efflux pump
MPILAMTVVLIAVYIPIGFQGGLTGALFTEFAFTLAGSVAVSGVVALTLSPMMCSKILKHEETPGKFLQKVDSIFSKVENGYKRRRNQHSIDMASHDCDGRIITRRSNLFIHNI